MSKTTHNNSTSSSSSNYFRRELVDKDYFKKLFHALSTPVVSDPKMRKITDTAPILTRKSTPKLTPKSTPKPNNRHLEKGVAYTVGGTTAVVGGGALGILVPPAILPALAISAIGYLGIIEGSNEIEAAKKDFKSK